MDRFAHLEWPFFEPRHAELARAAERWAVDNVLYAHDEDVDAVCRRLVKGLGAAGFLAHCAPEDSRFDVRSLALLREVFAFHSGLADFALTMQGLGAARRPARRTRRSAAVARAGERRGDRRVRAVRAGRRLGRRRASTRAFHDGTHYVLDGAKT
jgi:acyl-CoA dehydrogenase